MNRFLSTVLALASLVMSTGCPSPGGEGQDAGAAAAPPDAGGFDGGALDAGALDAGLDAGAGSRYWDGGTCAVKTDCPCFSSDDCPPTHWCHSEDTSGLHVYCVAGTRGSGVAGAACTGEADCASALCTDSSISGQRCSALCDSPQECPAALPKCLYVGFGVDRSMCAP